MNKAEEATQIPAPISDDGEVLVDALDDTTAQTLTVQSTRSERPQWYEFHADGAAVYLTFGPDQDGNHTAPVIASESTGSRAYKLEAGEKRPFQLGGRSFATAVKHLAESGGSGYLRVALVNYGKA